MKYVLTDNSRVNFVAHAPLHRFKGWAEKGVQGGLEIDLAGGVVRSLHAEVETSCLQTPDQERTQAMRQFFNFADHPYATFKLAQEAALRPVGTDRWNTQMPGILSFVDIHRQLPVKGMLRRENERLIWELQCKWSFKAYGLKAPRLLMLTVRDIVDISARLEFIPKYDKDLENVHQ
nr:YceI family protein [uncultured Desulfobulbus sp.]